MAKGAKNVGSYMTWVNNGKVDKMVKNDKVDNKGIYTDENKKTWEKGTKNKINLYDAIKNDPSIGSHIVDGFDRYINCK